MRWAPPNACVAPSASGGELDVRFLEVLANVGDELAIRRVVDCLDADDLLLEPGIVAVSVLDQLELGSGRTEDEDRLGAGESLNDVVIIGLVLLATVPVVRACLAVEVGVPLLGVN